VHNDTDLVTLQRAVPELNHLRIVPPIRGDASAPT
jgi:hypothetical protein